MGQGSPQRNSKDHRGAGGEDREEEGITEESPP